jgi:hypothetical protein
MLRVSFVLIFVLALLGMAVVNCPPPPEPTETAIPPTDTVSPPSPTDTVEPVTTPTVIDGIKVPPRKGGKAGPKGDDAGNAVETLPDTGGGNPNIWYYIPDWFLPLGLVCLMVIFIIILGYFSSKGYKK